MYKKLTKALLYTREDFSKVCKAFNIDPEYADPALLDTVMCDNCGYWETPFRAVVSGDDTVLCRTCDDLETLRF